MVHQKPSNLNPKLQNFVLKFQKHVLRHQKAVKILRNRHQNTKNRHQNTKNRLQIQKTFKNNVKTVNFAQNENRHLPKSKISFPNLTVPVNPNSNFAS